MPSLEKSNAYSSLSQLTSRIYPDGSRATFSYDEVGNRTLMADSTGRYTSMYDAVGQTMVKASPNNQRHSYSYDPIGTRRLLDASGAGRFTYAYDLTGQVTSLRNPYGERTTFSYDDSGRRTVQRNANGTRVSTVYDAASQTTEVIHRTSAGASLLHLEYRYDNAGNRNEMIEGGGTARTTWSYDAQNQLIGEYRTGTHAYRQSFTFDPAGNRTLKNIDGARTTYAYDSANPLRYGQAAAGGTTFQYDLTGNQRIEQPPTGNRTTTTWNYENQPTLYRLPSGVRVTMAYNGDNRRISLQQGANTTKFVWDSVIDAYVKELDGSNVVIATYTNEPQHYGGVLSQRRGAATSILHADALGTTRLLTDSTQTTTDTYLYDAWGNLITGSGITVMPFRWVGRYGYYMDSTTGLVYVRARMYMPTVARWISLDPIGYTSGTHLYLYGTLSPIVYVDPSGEAVLTIGGALAGCLAGGVSSLVTSVFGEFLEGNLEDSYEGEWDFTTACCRSLCEAAGGCISTAIPGAVVTSLPHLTFAAGCVGAALGAFLGDLCKLHVCHTGTPLGQCNAYNYVTNGILGCLRSSSILTEGRAREALEKVLWAIGFNQSVADRYCSKDYVGQPAPITACCLFRGSIIGGLSTLETPCNAFLGETPWSCCFREARKRWIEPEVVHAKGGTCRSIRTRGRG